MNWTELNWTVFVFCCSSGNFHIGNSGCFPQGRPAVTKSSYPTSVDSYHSVCSIFVWSYHRLWGLLFLRQMDMGSLTCTHKFRSHVFYILRLVLGFFWSGVALYWEFQAKSLKALVTEQTFFLTKVSALFLCFSLFVINMLCKELRIHCQPILSVQALREKNWKGHDV